MWVQKVPGGGVAHLAYSPGGETLYTFDNGGWLTAWDLASRKGRRLSRIEPDYSWKSRGIYTLADGETVVTRMDVVGYWEATLNQDGTIAEPPVVFALWDATTGQVLTRLEPPGLDQGLHVQVLPDGRVFYAGPGGGEITGWNLRTNNPELSFIVPGLMHTIHNFELSPDGRFLSTMYLHGGPAILYRIANGAKLQDPILVESSANSSKTTFSPDSHLVAVFSYHPNRVALWDIRTRATRVRDVPCDFTHGLFSWNPTAPMFASLNPDRVLTLYSLDTGKPLRSLDFALGRFVRCVAFSPDGLTCAVGGSNKQFAVFDVDL